MPTDRDFRYDLRPPFQPMLLPACALAAGIAVEPASGLPALAWVLASGAFSLAGLLVRRRSIRASLALGCMAVVCLGAGRGQWARAAAGARPLARLVDSGAIRPGGVVSLTGTLDAPPSTVPGRARLTLRVVEAGVGGGSAAPAGGRAAVTVSLRGPAAASALRAEGLGYGSPVRIVATVEDDLAYRNPGVAPLRVRLRLDGIDLAARTAPEGIEVLGPPAGCPLYAWIYGAREHCFEALDTAFPVREAGLLRALLLGDGSHLDRETIDIYRRCGAYHVLVVSGAHIALVAALLLFPIARLTRSPAMRLAAATAPVWAYCIMLGSPPPVVRSGLTLTIAMAAPLLSRRAPPANTVSVAACLVLAWDPASLYDSSFQLTFAAVAAIVLLAAPPLERFAEAGRWRPSRAAPYPPSCSRLVRACAEALHWDPIGFERGQRAAPLRYAPAKSRWASWLTALRLQAPARHASAALWVATVVQIALVPIAAAHFHRVAPAGIIATLAVEMLLGAALAVGFIFLTLSAFAPPLAQWCVPAVEALVHLSNGIAASTASGSWMVPAGTGWRAALPWVGLGLFVALAGIAARWRALPRSLEQMHARRRVGIVCVLAALGVDACIAWPPERPPGDGRLHVVFLDVGQGDSALVRFPTGETMLVDAGGRPRLDEPLGYEDGRPVYGEGFDIGERVVCEALWALGVSRLDYIAASHGDIDHVGGFDAVLARMRVGRALVTSGLDPHEARFRAAVDRAGVPITELNAGEVLEIGGARVEVLWPDASASGINDRSLVFRIAYGDRAILFTGDIEARGEREMLARSGSGIAADVLKVPHHGSRGSSTVELLGAVSPQWAVISAPRLSPYGHPHAEALARLRASGAHLVQTGLAGAIEVDTDGEDLRVTKGE